ncbi:hypothetical protein [Streptomyces sp. NPDC051162]|uniref:hypothetical protein n=1 Tax=Streptomyces sp. NPDC051162 TaxID=3154747 RepID=UPI00343D7808
MNSERRETGKKPEKGAFVVDVPRGPLSEVMGHEGPFLQLRPPRGGREWEARLDDTRPATDAEKPAAKVQAANAGSRWGK